MFRDNQRVWTITSLATAVLAMPLMLAQQPQYWPQQQGDPAQYPQPPAYQQPANFSPPQLDQIVSKIALYPDPLLAQIFAAATFPEQIQDAAQWSDQHHYLSGSALAQAIQFDQLPYDPSVQALLPFPSVLDMMAGDMDWTASLGNAFLSQGSMVQDAVQRMRRLAYNDGYLQSGGPIQVNNGSYITIAPTDPGYVVVPYYNPAVVFYGRYRPGFGVGISFGYGVSLGGYFEPWGWGGNRFAWDRHEVFINNREWDRRWDNRESYVHPYAGVERRGFAGAPAYRGGDVRGGDVRGGDFRRNGAEMQRGNVRPVDVRPGVVRPEVGHGPPQTYQRPPEQHQLENRSPVERRFEQQGRPVPRENHSNPVGVPRQEDHRR